MNTNINQPYRFCLFAFNTSTKKEDLTKFYIIFAKRIFTLNFLMKELQRKHFQREKEKSCLVDDEFRRHFGEVFFLFLCCCFEITFMNSSHLKNFEQNAFTYFI